jgi:hypothetical protein
MGTSGENSTSLKNIGVSWLDDEDGGVEDNGGSSKSFSTAISCEDGAIASLGSASCESTHLLSKQINK